MEYSNEPGLFTRFNLSPTEEKDGSTFNAFQIAWLHNIRADKVAALISLSFTPDNIVQYAQDEAYITGQIQLLDTLLSTESESSDVQ